VTTSSSGGSGPVSTTSAGSGGGSTTSGAGGAPTTDRDAAMDDARTAGPDVQTTDAGPTDLIGTPFKMLVFTKAVAFVHDSIPAGVQMLKDLSGPNKFSVTETADAGAFTDGNLKQYDEVFFVSTTGDVFSGAGAVGVTAKASFQKYMENGGGFAAVHAVVDCETSGMWPWFEDLIGAFWLDHQPDGTPGTVLLQPVDNPAIRGLPASWVRPNGDEWYGMKRPIDGRPGFTVLAKLASDQRPVSWIHELPGGGRVFLTIQGHNQNTYAEDTLRKHILGGVLWAAKRAK
jgi:type 1 glutamine amidotransferase